MASRQGSLKGPDRVFIQSPYKGSNFTDNRGVENSVSVKKELILEVDVEVQ